MPKRLCFFAAIFLLADTGGSAADLTVTVRDAKGGAVVTVAVPPGGTVETAESGATPAPPTDQAPAAASDPLTVKLQAAYAADDAAHKLVRARQLAAEFRFAAVALCQDPATANLQALSDKMKAVSKLTMPEDVLTAVRRAVADELNATVGRDPATPLDDAKRKQVAAQFARVARILEGVK